MKKLESFITGGALRGRKIASPQNAKTHPMGSRERLALFNSLSLAWPGAKVLDAFAGTGALGIEAGSRGAKEVIFVEKSPAVAQILRLNLQNLGVEPEAAQVVVGAAKNFQGSDFDVIMVDPPYDNFREEEFEPLPPALKAGGFLALSHPKSFDAPEWGKKAGLIMTSSKTYAGASISLFQKR